MLLLSHGIGSVITIFKGRLRVAIFKSAETVYLILLHYLSDAISCAVSAVSADLKMVARNRPLTIFVRLMALKDYFFASSKRLKNS